MKFNRQTLAFVLIALIAITTTVVVQAQEVPDPVEQPAPGWKSVAALLGAATILGKIFADGARLLPFIKNSLSPKIAWLACLLANVSLVAGAFIKSAGFEAAFNADPSGPALAGLGAFGPALKWLGASAIAVAQAALLKLIHERGNKVVFPELLRLNRSVTP